MDSNLLLACCTNTPTNDENEATTDRMISFYCTVFFSVAFSGMLLIAYRLYSTFTNASIILLISRFILFERFLHLWNEPPTQRKGLKWATAILVLPGD